MFASADEADIHDVPFLSIAGTPLASESRLALSARDEIDRGAAFKVREK
jgi:hypothetical protein